MQPLEGVVVVDFSTLLPGPLTSLLLAEAGAEVIKVERPGIGDEMRHYPPFLNSESVMFALLNRGKSSLAVDLKFAEDRARLDPYLARADIVIEQFRPGVMDRVGLGYEALSKRFPKLIYCSITGFGQTGPMAQVAGHDLNYIAQTGLLALSMGQAEPTIPPALIADIAGGAYPAMMNILLALEARRKTGKGVHLDVSMSDNMFPLAWWALGQRTATGTSPGNSDTLLNGGTARYRLYPTSDGQVVAAAPIEQRFWDNFCDVLGVEPAIRADAVNPVASLETVTKIIASKSGSYWRKAFASVDCCCTMVETLDDALANPHFQGRGVEAYQTTLANGKVIPALPVPIAPVFRADPEISAESPPPMANLQDS